MNFHHPIESDDPKVIDAPKGIPIGNMEFYNPKVFGYNFIFDGLVRMPARWLCSNPGFQYSSAGGEGLLIQTLIPNQSQSPQIHQTAHMPLTTRLFRYNQRGAACRGNMLESLQEILCKLARKYCWETANCREGSFGFVSTGEGGQGAPLFFLSPYLHWWHRDKEMWKYLADEGSEELGWEFRFLAEICGMRN